MTDEDRISALEDQNTQLSCQVDALTRFVKELAIATLGDTQETKTLINRIDHYTSDNGAGSHQTTTCSDD